ncbi:MAG TPA: C25 family cysteine peptidase [Anaerolineae bacterium]|nr:C25 family cysteine peptidase [Anaerolineae bacterium]
MTLTTSRELFAIAKLSLDLGHEDLGVFLLQHLLDELPGHVAAHCLLGHRQVALEGWAEAEEHFQYPLTVDPLNLSALAGMARVDVARVGSPKESKYARMLCDLYPRAGETRGLLEKPWDDSAPLGWARILTSAGRHEEAIPYYEAACQSAPDDPEWRAVLELLLTQALWTVGRLDRARPLADRLVSEHGMWVRPMLMLADMALQQRDDALGTSLIHDAMALDASCVIAGELLATDRRYDWLLERTFQLEGPSLEELDGVPEVLRCLLSDEPLPAPLSEVEYVDGQLSSATRPGPQQAKGEITGPPASSASQREQPSISALSLEEQILPPEPEEMNRVRLIITSRDRITARYGEDGYQELDARLSELCEAVARSTGDESIKIYVDEDSSLAEFGLGAVDPSDARQIAGLLGEFESRLGRETRKVASLLIVGGDEVIPFHRLANPADDEDPEVLSDWPYAAVEGSFVLSRFSVGRLPDCGPADLEGLLGLVEHTIAHHNSSAGAGDGVSASSWLNPFRRLLGARHHQWTSIGYSAEIWAEASRSVFEIIGDSSKLQVSPPLTDYDFLSTYEQFPTLGYFNLHGFRGSPYWYGHGESEYGSPLVPIALTPLSVSWASAQGAFVYSEACYGADLMGEYPDGSIAQNILGGGALGFVGCTAMSYGTLAPPLSGADLLGAHLWEGLLGGLPIGDALRRARAAFVRSVAGEQGYLDGEDQKALVSFVLYGDPSLSLRGAPMPPDLETEVEVACPPLACCSRMMDAEALPLPKEVRQKVEKSLPFLQDNGFLAHPLILCRAACSSGKCGSRSCSCEPSDGAGVSGLIQASQQHVVSKGGDQLRHVVKVTVNADGDVVKVLVSRGGTRTHEGNG